MPGIGRKDPLWPEHGEMRMLYKRCMRIPVERRTFIMQWVWNKVYKESYTAKLPPKTSDYARKKANRDLAKRVLGISDYGFSTARDPKSEEELTLMPASTSKGGASST